MSNQDMRLVLIPFFQEYTVVELHCGRVQINLGTKKAAELQDLGDFLQGWVDLIRDYPFSPNRPPDYPRPARRRRRRSAA